MKYALLFAATAAAYDAYGVPSKPSSTPVYGDYGHVTKVTPSHGKATPCSTTVGKNGYTTVVPGYGKQPVTVTKQHQAYPTCVAKGYDGKSCDKWEDDKYVSTTITDYNKKVVTVTKVQDYVTVYHEKKTITHYATPSAGGYGAYPTGSAKNATGNWYELYEKVYVCKYEDMGKNVLVGYTGSGLCQKCDDEQPIMQKEYKNGKWVEEKKTLNYGKPKEDVKVYEKPGVYTVPGKTVTVYEPKQTGGYEKHVYQHEVKTITITKPGETYTCKYNEAKKTPTKGDEYPPKVTKTPTKGDYDHKATPTPKKPEQDYPDRPHKSYPSKPSSTPCDDDKTKTPIYNKDHPTPTPYKPVYGGDYDHKPSTSVPSKPSTTPYKPVYGDDYKPSHSVPSKPSSTPCDDDKKKSTPTPYKPVYDDHKPTPTPNKPVYDNNNGYGSEHKPTPTPNKPVYDDNNKPSYDSGKPSYDNGKPSYDNDNNKPSYDNSGKPSYDNGKPSYDNNKPSYGAGYSKRSGMKARREAMAAQ